MSVERCPSCGRTWDGLLCFACGHERGKTPRAAAAAPTVASPLAPPAPAPLSTSPSTLSTGRLTAPMPAPAPATPPSRTGAFPPPQFPPPQFPPPQFPPPQGLAPTFPPSVPPPTFARSPTPVAQFAPLPPLPPLGRSPTGAAIPGVGPQLPQGHTLPQGTPAPAGLAATYTPLAPASTLPPPPSFSPSPSFMTPGVLAGNPSPPPPPVVRSDTAPAPFPGFSRNSDHATNPGTGGSPSFPAAPSSGFIPPPPSASAIPRSTPSARSPYAPGGPAAVGRDTSPLGFPAPQAQAQAPLPPLPPIQSRAIPPAQPRPARPAPGTPPGTAAPATPAAAAARYDDEEQTAESSLPSSTRWKQLLRRLYLSPAVFGAAFLVGFTLTFLPGVIIAFQKPSVADMIEKHRYPEAIAELQRRRDAGEMKPGDWLLFGNALQLQYGPLQWDQMLQMYQMAAGEKRVDATALENTVSALGDKERQKKAIEVLAAWPASSDRRVDPTMKLAGRAGDDNFFVRHGAIEALKQRNAPADLIDDAVAACALADLRSRSCENNAAHAGLTDLERLIMKGAKAAIAHHDPNDALLAIAGSAAAQAACVDPKAVDHVLKDRAAMEIK